MSTTSRRAALAFLAFLAACGRGPTEVAGPAAAPTAAWRVRAPGGLQPIATGTTDPALLDATTCRGCHAEAYAEWAGSRHGQAWDNGLFRREYREQPRQWCVNCHAPTDAQVDELATADGPLASQGVSCAACHVRGGRLVARKRSHASPHDTVADASFGSAAFCADCHQFTFPRLDRGGEPIDLSRHPMQDTVAQFARGPYAGTHDCLDCHAATRGGHGFAGAHDPGMLARALSTQLCMAGDRVRVVLENRGAGHNLPTGDIHRHIVARVWRASAPEALFEIFIGRRYEDDPAGGKRTTWDSTLAPRQRRAFEVALSKLAGELDEPVRLEVRYVYTADERPARDRDPGEPTTMLLTSERHALSDLPRCKD